MFLMLKGMERDTNVFLRARMPHVKAALGLPMDISSLEAFTLLRQMKDKF